MYRVGFLSRSTSSRAVSFSVCLAVFCFSAGAQAENAYKCVASDGRIEYRELQAADMECTLIRSSTRSTPSDDAAQETETQETSSTPAAPQTEQTQLSEAEQLQQNCDRAKRNLAILQSSSDVVRTDAEGNKIVMSENEREAALAQAEKDIDYWCEN